MKSYICIILSLLLFSCTSTKYVILDKTLPLRIKPSINKKNLTLEEARYCLYEKFKKEKYKNFIGKGCDDKIEKILSNENYCNFDLISKDHFDLISKEIEENKNKILDETKIFKKICSSNKNYKYHIVEASLLTIFGAGLILDPILTLKIIGGVYVSGFLLWGIATYNTENQYYK